jgi:DegV family protein with EDD domain
MSKVAVVADTICCLPPELAREYGIRLIPVSLVIDRKVYNDISLSNEQFWEMFYKAKEPITTNAINPGDFESVFSELARETDSIVCILVSKVLTATFNNAVIAAKMVQEEKPGIKIEIIDSVSAAGAEGFIVLEAAKAAREGKSLAEVVQVIKETIPRVNFFCTMETMKYLIRIGRAPKIAHLGDMMKVKPIISLNKETGLVENVGRARGMLKAMEKMVEMVKENTGTEKPVKLMVHYTDDPGAADELKKMALQQLPNCKEVYTTPYTPVMAAACGPVVAISYYV